MVSGSSVNNVCLTIRQGIAEEVGNLFLCHYQATMYSSEANADIRSYIHNVLVKRMDRKKLVVGNPELVNEITDALVQEANGMLVCHTKFLWRALTEIGLFGLLSKLKVYAARSVTVMFVKQFENSQKKLPETYNRIFSRIEELKNRKLAKKYFPG